jgi:uncharacterized repeat protein (TIGR01451 family)
MIRRMLCRGAVLLAIPFVVGTVPQATARAAGTQPFAITITHVECVDDCDATGLESALEGHADFYAKVFFDGVKQPAGSNVDDPSTPVIDNNPSIDPFWVVSTQLPATAQKVVVTIQIWDHDTTSGDDLGDASPKDGDNNLDFVVPLIGSDTGKWFDPYTDGDNVNWPQNCSTGDGGANDEPRVKVCFDVSAISTSGDADGDGLLDGWERYGYNDNGDGSIDVNLPAMGANPNHKDLFLELDTVAGRAPTHAGILAIKKAFAAAPLNAGSNAGSRQAPNGGTGANAPPNPDGLPGINLHVDTGALVDPTAREGAPAGSCSDGIDNGGDGLIDGNDPSCIGALTNYLDASVENPGAPNCTDGIDNDGDGLADANDPDCLVGDNLGGGNVIAPPNACGLDANFYATKAANFNPNRRLIFRYAEMAARPGAPTCSGASGGQGEIGGNDFAVFNLDAGTIMHELGHTLNLHHGGFEDTNCKPDYVSLMNYDLQGGIPRVGGGTILDYSPPRIALNGSTRGVAPLGPLVENGLTETTPLNGSDPSNRFVFVNGAGQKITNNLNQIADWDNDGVPGVVPTPPTNIDTVGLNGRPANCANGSTNETLRGADDWTFVSLPFRQFGDSASAGLNLETEDVPTTQDLLAMHDEINTTDVGITKSDNPDPVAAGTNLTYTLVAANHGPNPATSVKLVDTLPSQVSFLATNPACSASGQTVTCGLGDIASGATRTVTITVHVPADLVYNAGGPVDIVNRAAVDNLAGPDPNASNDSASETTRVIAVADLAITDFAPLTPPAQVLIGQTIDVTMRDTLVNYGPSSPMDGTVTTSATADPGSSVTPSSSSRLVTALAAGTPRSTDSKFTIGCSRPGMHTYRFTDSISPARVDDTDPNLANNEMSTEFTLDCVVPVALNIMPGANPNSINIPTDTVPVAVLTTHAGEYGLPLDFDAATIQPLTVRFGPRRVVYPGLGGSTEVHQMGHIEDAYERTTTPVETVKDGDLDMVLHFASGKSSLTATDVEACVKGSFIDPVTSQTYRFFGCDSVRIVKPKT